MNKKTLHRFRMIGIAEGISFLVLLLIAMPLKYFLNFIKKSEKTMENTFLARANQFISTVFDKIAVSRTRQALISLDDRTLADIGFTRQQVLNGDFFNVTDVVDFPVGSLGLTKTVKQDNKVEDKEAA
mgnify:CR=1 FL=1